MQTLCVQGQNASCKLVDNLERPAGQHQTRQQDLAVGLHCPPPSSLVAPDWLWNQPAHLSSHMRARHTVCTRTPTTQQWIFSTQGRDCCPQLKQADLLCLCIAHMHLHLQGLPSLLTWLKPSRKRRLNCMLTTVLLFAADCEILRHVHSQPNVKLSLVKSRLSRTHL